MLLSGCGAKTSPDISKTDGGNVPAIGDEAYESRVITVTGADLAADKTITVSGLRALPQHHLDASFKRTTGLIEEYKMEGPYLSEVFSNLGIDLSSYAAIGVEGTDNYYCLIPADIIEQTPDLMIALTIDGEAVLGDDLAPAMLAVQGQFGPYWVKMISKITLYTEIPEKDISSVWVFDNLVEGIEPYEYEYYGSRDKAIDIAQIFSRFDYVNSESFLTMKSSDGFIKNETLNMVNHGYYIKFEGEDAPTNVAANIQLGMNVQNISWFSTNADSVIFPEELSVYMDQKTINGKTGIPLSEIMYEAGVSKLKGVVYDVLGTDGSCVTTDGSNLSNAILVTNSDGTYSVEWSTETGFTAIKDLMRVRVSKDQSSAVIDESSEGSDKKDENKKDENKKDEEEKDVRKPDDILTITGSGVKRESYWSMAEIKALGAYGKTSYSAVNNWPTRKTYYANGVTLSRLLDAAGLNTSYGTVTLTASDGVYITLTFDQAFGSLWSYPNIASSSSSGGFRVPALIAWMCSESSSGKESGSLRCVIGQHGVNDVNTSAWISDIVEISVSDSGRYAWSEPTPSLAPGAVESGSGLSFSYDSIDRAKIYYTTDGSTPTYSSTVYNPSTTYYQPGLTVPITIDRDMTVRILICGWGRPDATYSYSYTIAAAEPPIDQPADPPVDDPSDDPSSPPEEAPEDLIPAEIQGGAA